MNPSDWLGGLYEETGLFEGPSAKWDEIMGKKLIMQRAVNTSGLFRKFYNAWGPEVMKKAYDWDDAPGVRPFEREFEFQLASDEVKYNIFYEDVGFGSLSPDPLNKTEIRLSLGILPTKSGQGYRKQMVTQLAQYAFDNLGAKLIIRYIYNPDVNKTTRLVEGTAWHSAGWLWYPFPVLVIAVKREDWDEFNHERPNV